MSANIELFDRLVKSFPKFKILLLGNGCQISVPNGNKVTTISKSGNLYEVRGECNSTHISFKNACHEILLNLVTREMLSLGFSESEVKLVSKLLLE